MFCCTKFTTPYNTRNSVLTCRVNLPQSPVRYRRYRRQLVTDNNVTSTAFATLQLYSTVAANDLYATLFTGISSILWVKIFDLLTYKGWVQQKLSRKLVHISTGPLFVLTWPLFSDNWYTCLLAAIVPLLNALRLLCVGLGLFKDEGLVKSVSREGNKMELLRGPLFYTIILVFATIVFWRTSIAGMVMISCLCGGDGLADIVGRRFGQSNKLPYNKNKSWAGSIAMFVASVLMCQGYLRLFTWLGYLAYNMNIESWVVLFSCFLATVVESLPIDQFVDDNLSVPVVAAVVMSICGS